MNLISLLQNIVKKYSDKSAIIDADENINITYFDLFEKIKLLAFYYKSNGIDKDHKVGIFLRNSPFQITSFFSLLYLNAIPVLIDDQYTEREIKDCIDSSNIEFMISENHEKKILKLQSIENIKKIFIFSENYTENSFENLKKNFTFFNNSSLTSFLNKEKKINQINDNDYFSKIILFTYRGIGKILPVILSEQAIINSINKNNLLTEVNSTLKISLFLPFTHILALTCNILSPLSVGGTIVITNLTQPYRILNTIEKYEINFIIAVPTLIKVLIHSIRKKNYKLNSLKRGIVGGNKFSKILFDEWKELTGCTLLQGYGLTETCPVFCNQWEKNKPDSMGLPMNNVMLKILNKEGNTLSVNQQGNLWIKTDSLMDGYYNMNDLNDNHIKDGWFDTGDIAYMDEEGFLYFVKREKKICKIGGITVDIIEIENQLRKHPDIIDIQLSIENDDLWQEKIVCRVKSRKKLDKLDILSYYNDKLTYNKIPKDFIFI